MKMHGMNRDRNKEFFNPIWSNLSVPIDGYYRYIELYENEPIKMLEESNKMKKERQCHKLKQMPEIIISNKDNKKNSENLLNIVTDEYRSLIPRICQIIIGRNLLIGNSDTVYAH
jgi:hypothetical protein